MLYFRLGETLNGTNEGVGGRKGGERGFRG